LCDRLVDGNRCKCGTNRVEATLAQLTEAGLTGEENAGAQFADGDDGDRGSSLEARPASQSQSRRSCRGGCRSTRGPRLADRLFGSVQFASQRVIDREREDPLDRLTVDNNSRRSRLARGTSLATGRPRTVTVKVSPGLRGAENCADVVSQLVLRDQPVSHLLQNVVLTRADRGAKRPV
jgi:hypothetical protein